ncbi:MAG: hypothetical protein HUK26_04060, partial [Duodenibacillus sp.]|nr:hypothetical protein [Duodenibacillus sp.]
YGLGWLPLGGYCDIAGMIDDTKEAKMNKRDLRLAITGDLLHNIAKEDKNQVLTNTYLVARTDKAVKSLQGAGYLKGSPAFWTDTSIFKNPKLGNNRGHVHHLTGTVVAGQIAKSIGFSDKEITDLQVGIIEHSTGYWYFRTAVDGTLQRPEGWRLVFPAPENQLADYIHDADLVSQFVYESVVPEGSKWRNLASKRWGADNTAASQAHVVYYVFQRLYDEARTPMGQRLAKEQWDRIAPELKKLMGLSADQDPIKVKGVPAAFK